MPSSNEPDNPLLSDSPRAWDELIQAVGPASLLVAIEGRLSQALKRSVAAEDILQESLLHAWTSRGTCEWRGVRAFRSWLLSIIDNRICDAADRQGALKRGGGVPAQSLSSLPTLRGRAARGMPHLPASLIDSNTPSRLAMYQEHALVMKQALDQLPEELRDVVRLRLIEQRPLEAIAQALGLGVAAVRHRFRKGAEQYHRQLKCALASRRDASMERPPGIAPPENGSREPDS